ncbi:MAG: hypothetical protein IT232_02745 [Flavobacteriales bacterium]|nr:hypothetical protein [Flavobacteriales bacterium]
MCDLGDAPELSCFAQCFRSSMSQCGGHFACSLMCGFADHITLGLGCGLAFGTCCALDCKLGNQGSNCIE